MSKCSYNTLLKGAKCFKGSHDCQEPHLDDRLELCSTMLCKAVTVLQQIADTPCDHLHDVNDCSGPARAVLFEIEKDTK